MPNAREFNKISFDTDWADVFGNLLNISERSVFAKMADSFSYRKAINYFRKKARSNEGTYIVCCMGSQENYFGSVSQYNIHNNTNFRIVS